MLAKQFFSFVVIGISNTLMSFLIYYYGRILLTSFEYRSAIAQFLAYAIPSIWSFYWNRRLTFRSGGPVIPQIQKFVFVQVVMSILTSALLGLLVDMWGMPSTITWFLIVIPAALANFLICKYWVWSS